MQVGEFKMMVTAIFLNQKLALTFKETGFSS
jgi:hypothetical protein